MEIIPATIQDIPVIQHIASLTWPTAFAEFLSPRQMEYMLNSMYNRDVILKQMTEEAQFFFLLKENGNLTGFAGIGPYQYEVPKLPPIAKVWKLHKLYILPRAQRSGAGRLLMNFCMEEIIAKGGNYVILNVNRENRAFQFYQKNGFEVLETGDYDIGAGFYMNDHIMGKSLEALPGDQ